MQFVLQNCKENCRIIDRGTQRANSLAATDSPGEGERRNEFAEWHVAWLAE